MQANQLTDAVKETYDPGKDSLTAPGVTIKTWVLISVSLIVFWKVWSLPYRIPYLLLDRLAILACLYYYFRVRGTGKELFPGKQSRFIWLLLLVLAGCIVSFCFYVLESSISEHYSNTLVMNSLTLMQMLKSLPYTLALAVFFTSTENFRILARTLLIGTFVIMLLVTFGLDERVMSMMGYTPPTDDYLKLVESLLYVRRTFVTMNSNTYVCLLAGFFMIGVYMFFREKRPAWRVFYAVCCLLCISHIVQGSGRTGSLELVVGFILFMFLIRRSIGGKLVVYASIACVGLVFCAFFVMSTEAYQILMLRWSQIAPTIHSLMSFEPPVMDIRDDFSMRIYTALAAMPTNAQEWVIGTGGVQTGMLPGITYTVNHVDLINWLGQYGLITFIPLMALFYSLFNYFRRRCAVYRRTLNTGDDEYFLAALAISLLAGFIIQMLTSPLFFGFWFWTGFMLAIAGLLEGGHGRIVAKPQ